MKYAVDLADQARADLFGIATWIAADFPENAARWLVDIEGAVRGLDRIPDRCPLAIEALEIDGCALRQLVHGNYRILFVVSGARVHVLHIRHAARRPAELARLDPGSAGAPLAERT